MSSLANTHFNRYSAPADNREVWLALIISLCLHLAIVYLIPYLNRDRVAPMTRIEIEMSSTLAPATSAQPPTPEKIQPIEPPTPQPPVKNKPVKNEVTQPVLSSPEPAQQNDYVVPENPATNTSSAPAVAEASKPSTESASDNTSKSSDQPIQSEEATEEEAWDGYGQLLYEIVSKNKSYPPIAIKRGWEGKVKVKAKFHLGKLVEITLLDASGRKVLDDEAIAIVRKAVAQLPVSGGLARKSFMVNIPVTFSLSE